MSSVMVDVPGISATPRRLARTIGSAFGREPRFLASGLFLAALILPTAVALVVDARTLDGIDIWMKPLKFEVALSLYLLTLALFANWLPAGTTEARWYRVYSGMVVAAILAEMVWIGGAAALGTRSHFNLASGLSTGIYAMMGVFAVFLTSASLVYGVLIRRNRETGLPPAFKTALVDGLVLTFVLTLVVAGTMSGSGSHLVAGNASDVEAAPLFGWARDGGDLRVAHLFATHAMHALPVFAIASVLLFGRERILPVRLFAGAYVLLVAFTFVQALMGRPFLPMIG